MMRSSTSPPSSSYHPSSSHSSLFGLLLVLLLNSELIFGQFFPQMGGNQQQMGNYWGQDYESGQQPQNSFNTASQFLPSGQQAIFGQWAQQPGQQYFQPPPPPPPSHGGHHSSFQLPYASYRGSAFSAPPSRGGIDPAQRERLARIAEEGESFGTERARVGGNQPQMEGSGLGGGGGDGIQRILATFAEKLPKIAETMARLGGGVDSAGRPSSFPSSASLPKEKFMVEEFEGGGEGKEGISLSRREYDIGGQQTTAQNGGGGGGGLIDSMPEPSSLFSFNKLFTAFGASENRDKATGNGQRPGETGFDVKGTPILKSEDIEPELIMQQKSTKEESFRGPKQPPPLAAHLTPPPELPPPQNPLNSFLQQFGIANFMPTSTGAPKSERAADGEGQRQMGAEEENGDLFGSLMKGKMPQMPNWLKQFGLEGMFGAANGTKQGNGGQGGAEEPGNALAQLFGGGKGGGKGGGFGLGSVLGSGLDDSPR